jgi:hypothetical protein
MIEFSRRQPIVVLACLFIGFSFQALSEGNCQTTKRRQKKIHDRQTKMRTVDQQHLIVTGKSLLTINANESAIVDSRIDLDSPEAWVLFPALSPSVVQQQYLTFFFVAGKPAELGQNVRIAPVGSGSCVIPHGPDHVALTTYQESNFRGDPMSHVIHKYYWRKQLGSANDKISSFRLQHGYMATFAENADGTGASKVYIASNEDLEIRSLPKNLRDNISFVRVFPWRWTNKKGFGGNQKSSEMLATNWRYDWGAGGQSTLDMEYIPMRHNAHWDSFKKINSLENTTAVLGFNEPMKKDQANMSLEKCIEMWPKLMASGLRIGSIAPTDGSLSFLYQFIDMADQKGLRVDFIAVHCYHANRSPEKWVQWLKKIHLRTGRPIWVTEFNNGAPWTRKHNPNFNENARHLKSLMKAMDAAPFVERYAIFNLTAENGSRHVIKDGELTPAGKMYRDHKAPMAVTSPAN